MLTRANLKLMCGLPSPKPRSASLFAESDARLSSRRLPVPPLRQTLDSYLKSLYPFLRQDEDCGGPSCEDELFKRTQWAAKFEKGLGAALQQRLLALDKVSPYNWLDDNFWMKAAYLQSRASLVINSNWWCAYQPDASIPTIPKPEPGQYTFWQVRRAAWLVHKMLEYRAELEKKATQRADSLEVPFQMPFYRCRIPGEPCDTLASLPTRGTAASRNITLMLHDWCYAIEVLDHTETAIPVAQIEARIWSAIHDLDHRRRQGEDPIPIGVLTTSDRTTWSKIRKNLLDFSPRNRVTFKAIEDSILVLSLDDYTLSLEGQSTPIQDVDLDAHVRNVSSGIAGRNRWFDKCVSIFVESNARAGGMGEHSPCDGLVVGAMMDYSLSENVDSRQFERTSGTTPNSAVCQTDHGWERLDWRVSEKIKDHCVDAEQKARAISDNSDASMLCFTDYGSGWIKNKANLSPDAYVQMAMQLAWHTTQGDFTAVYETATTQMFTHGRTETIRSFSTESWQFVKAMVDPRCSTKTQLLRLQDAVHSHNSLSRQAIKGQGIDRHLLGLRLLMKDGEETELFSDPLFQRSQTWKLSTSGLFRGERFSGTGFGSPLEDGYGIQYILDPEILKFGVECKRSCLATSTERFKTALVKSLRDMRNLFEERLKIKHNAQL